MKRIPPVGLVALLICSCGKDDNDLAPAKMDIVTADPWRITGGQLEGNAVKFAPCIDDDVLSFEPDGDFAWSNGAVRCNPTQSVSEQGQWQLVKDETELTIIVSAHPTPFRIVEIANGVMTLKKKEDGLIYFFQAVR